MTRRNPYKLFDYYTEADEQLFFGREQEISAVVGDILANKLLVLFARSGSGKTSLLNAGISPALNDIGRVDDADPAIKMVTVRLSADVTPEESALNALKEALIRPLPDTVTTLQDALRILCGDTEENRTNGHNLRGVVLVFDQFEELFISLFKDRPDIRAAFGKKLADIIYDTNLRAYVVLSLRSDHFHQLNEFRGIIPSIFQNNTNLELRPFDDDAALRVIKGPAGLPNSGFSWEASLPERIVADLKPLNDDSDGVLPIHVQIICHGLFDSLKPSEIEITHRHYESHLDKISRSKAIASPAQAMIDNRIIAPLAFITGKQRRDLVRLLRELVTQHRTKSVRSFAELAPVLPEDRLKPLLEYLEKKLLVRVVAGQDKTWYELRHDYLALVIDPWLTRQEQVFERKDFLRRFIIAFCLIAATALGTKLWYDWHSYYAEIGGEGHKDELVVKRRPAFGIWQPAFWALEIKTGFQRQQLQASGVPHFQFDVPNGMIDWREIEPHLLEKSVLPLQLAVNNKTLAAINTIEKNNNDLAQLLARLKVENEPDIALYAAVDQGILNTLHLKFNYAEKPIKQKLFVAFRNFLQLSTDGKQRLLQDLLSALKDKDPAIRQDTAEILAFSTQPVNNGSKVTNEVFEGLLQALKDSDINVVKKTADSLISLAPDLDRNQITTMVVDSVVALKSNDPTSRLVGTYKLAIVAKYLELDQIKSILPVLIKNLQPSDYEQRYELSSASKDTLQALANTQNVDITQLLLAYLHSALNQADVSRKLIALDLLNNKVFEHYLSVNQPLFQDLRQTLGDANPSIKASSLEIVLTLSKNKRAELGALLVNELWAYTQNKDVPVRSLSIHILGNLSATVNAPTATKIIARLAAMLATDSSDNLKSETSYAMGQLANSLNPKDFDAFVAEHLRKINNKDEKLSPFSLYILGQLTKLSGNQLIALVDVALKNKIDLSYNLFTNDGPLLKNLDESKATLLYNRLIPELHNPDPTIKTTAITILPKLATLLNPPQALALAKELLQLSDEAELKYIAESALQELTNYLQEENTTFLINELIPLLNNADKKFAILRALLNCVKSFNGTQANTVANELKTVFNDQSISISDKTAAAQLLGVLANRLDFGLANQLAADLIASEKDNSIKTALPPLFELTARSKDADLAGLAFMTSDRIQLEQRKLDKYLDYTLLLPQRTLAKADWAAITTETLVEWLTHDDSRKRVFAAHVLAQRPLDASLLTRIKTLRDDPEDRPWVKMAALKCLVEIEREKQAVIYEAKEKEKAGTKD